MAKRFSGNVRVDIRYRDSGDYLCKLSTSEASHKVIVRPPAIGFGEGIAYDSPEAYDRTAAAAVAFATEEGFDCEPEYDDRGEVSIRRTRAAKIDRRWYNFGDVNPQEYGGQFIRQTGPTSFEVVTCTGRDWEGFEKSGYLFNDGHIDLARISATEGQNAANVCGQIWADLDAIGKALAWLACWGAGGEDYLTKNYRQGLRSYRVFSYVGNIPHSKKSVRVPSVRSRAKKYIPYH